MLFNWDVLIWILPAYLFGSIPTAVWVGKSFFEVDVREHGSKNAGATNTFRVLGRRAGVPVLLFDIFKGWFPCFLFPRFTPLEVDTNLYIKLQIMLGVAAVIGHLFPLFANFKGGKGVATMLGILLAIHLKAALISFGIFSFFYVIFSYVSLGAIMAAVCFPFLLVWVFRNQLEALNYFAIAVSSMLIITHRKNIDRLLRGEEGKMPILGKKSPKN
jgi:glycerol-3-phosphate acyltransferase PlsY